MKKVVIGVLVVAAGIAGYYFYNTRNKGAADNGVKQEPIALKKHSEEFNKSVANAMEAYFGMSAAFVDADTAKVKEQCRNFVALLDSIPMDELKKDTANIYDVAMSVFSGIKDNAGSILTQTDIQEMRKDFGVVSENMYPAFFNIINYEGEKMYWQHCPMAFGDDNGANWVSKSKEIVNPYLGKNHPKYKGTMLSCGVVKDTIKAK